MKKLNKKGFTLVELLAVIVILALLMVVGIRTITNLQSGAQFEAAKTEGSKIASKNYEDLETIKLLPTHTVTYANLDTTGYTEGDFIIWINTTNTKICVTYKTNKKVTGSITNGVVDWGSATDFATGACTASDIA